MNTFKYLVLLLSLALTPVFADEYPSKPIKMVLPLPVGSSTDIVARIISTPLSQLLNQPIVITHKVGADGTIAGREVATSLNDGYTLLFATNTPMAAGPALRKKPPYDPVTDFTPISDIGRFTFFVVVHPSLNVFSIQQLINLAKKSPNTLTYGTGNTTGILGMAQFASLSGINLIHVPYKGEPQAVIDLVAGRINIMMLSSGTAIPQIQKQNVIPLSVTTSERNSNFSNIPTMKESGVDGFNIVSWAALYGPANLPKHIVDKINQNLAIVLKTTEIIESLTKIAFEINHSSPEKLLEFTKNQFETYKNALKDAGVEAQ
jgi:tripartite-type tricarboxylate transporter receptor subunit TctC